MARKKTDEHKAAELVAEIEAELNPDPPAGKAAVALAGAEKFEGPITDSLVDRVMDLGKPAIKAILKRFFPGLP